MSTGQLVQKDAPAVLIWPSGHGVHTLLAKVLPAGQGAHEELPEEEKVPVPHVVQVATPPAEKVPGLHAEQELACWTEL